MEFEVGEIETAFTKQSANALRHLQSRTGVLGSSAQLRTPGGDPTFHIWAAGTGNMASVLPGVNHSTRGTSTTGAIDGAGGSADPVEAQLLSLAEGLERYASCAYDEDQFIWASGAELGDEAMDLSTCASMSETEIIRNPTWTVPDPLAPQRWVRAISMLDGQNK